MAYNLPDAWDPGFVLPKNVHDEGLQRRGLVTKQMPRGTYDQPCVGTGGYVVPQYVMDEGYGQGTFTTKWQPSGSYVGPKVPHWLNRRPTVVREQALPGGGKVVTVQALNGDDDAIPPAYQDYGAKAAQVIITQVARVPVSQRSALMKTLLAKIDKSLWSRTNDIWKRYVSQGIAPDKAFPLALARAISAGFSAEVVDMGLRRQAPKANSLLGLGCYGLCGAPMGLGLVTAQDQDDSPSSSGQGAGTSGATTTPRPPPPPTLDLPDDPIFYVGGIPFRNDVPIKPWSGTTETTTSNSRTAPPMFQLEHPEQLTDDQIAFLSKYLTDKINANGQPDNMVHYDGVPGIGTEPDAPSWYSKLGIQPTTEIRMHNFREFRLGFLPVAWVTHPVTKENLAVHLTLARQDMHSDYNAATNPLALKAWLSRMPSPNWWSSLLQTVINLPVTLDPTGIVQAGEGVVKDVALVAVDIQQAIRDAIHKLTCQVLNSKEGETAGAAVATYYGAPPAAGVAGVKEAASFCPSSGQPAPIPLPLPVAKPSIVPIVLLAGGGMLALLLLMQKKKKKKTT